MFTSCYCQNVGLAFSVSCCIFCCSSLVSWKIWQVQLPRHPHSPSWRCPPVSTSCSLGLSEAGGLESTGVKWAMKKRAQKVTFRLLLGVLNYPGVNRGLLCHPIIGSSRMCPNGCIKCLVTVDWLDLWRICRICAGRNNRCCEQSQIPRKLRENKKVSTEGFLPKDT